MTGVGFAWIWPVIMVVGLVALAWGLTRALRPTDGPSRESRSTAEPEPARDRDRTRDRGASPPGPARETSPGQGRAREILRERYARGEISEQELSERMRTLDEP